MGRYLNALKKSGNGGGTTLQNLQNPLADSFVGFVGTPPPPFEINQAANDDDKHVDKLFGSFAWLIHFADRDPLMVTFSPEVTHADALAGYPDAVAAEPIPATPKRSATTDEAEELRQLIAAVYGDDAESDRCEALDTALADPEPALICYRAIALERGITPPHDDDGRRTCRQCSSFTYGGVCSVAAPGAAVSAMRGYRPAPDLQQRCEAFNERK